MPNYTRTYGPGFTGIASGETASYPVSCANRTLGPWGFWASGPAYFGYQKTVISSVTPGYFKKKAAGEILPSNIFYSRERSRINTGNTLFYTEAVASTCTPPLNSQGWYRGQYWGVYVSFYGLDSVDTNALPGIGVTDNLIRQVATQVRADRQKGKANLVESLAESHQAYDLFRHPFKGTIDFLDAFTKHKDYLRLQKMKRQFRNPRLDSIEKRVAYYRRRGKKGALLATLLASEWLRFRYGITPLMKDVQALMVALAKGYEKAPSVHRTLVTKSATGQKVSNLSKINGSYEYFYTFSQTSEFSVRGYARDMYKHDPFVELGLTFQNVVGVAWELTRFSFVVDWFVNVGDLLYANIPRVNVTTVSEGYSTRHTIGVATACNRVVSLSPSVSSVHGYPSDITVYREVVKNRSPLLPNASLVINYDFGFDKVNRVLDAASLVVQKLRGLSF